MTGAVSQIRVVIKEDSKKKLFEKIKQGSEYVTVSDFLRQQIYNFLEEKHE